MIPLASIDLSRFNGNIAMIQEALIGAGGDGDLQILVANAGAELAMTISDSLGPKSKPAAEAYVRQDVRSVFQDGPNQIFPIDQRGSGDMTWLFAKSDMLFGVLTENFQPSLSESGMQSTLRNRQLNRVGVSSEVSRSGVIKARTILGQRGKQRVVRLNRILVQRGRTASLAKSITNKRVGRLRATFAYAAHQLGRERIQKWIKDKFDQVSEDGSAIFNPMKLQNKEAPTLEFGGRAPGLIENFEGKILEAVDKASDRLANIASALIHGYAKDWESARRITSKANWMKIRE